jgi:hypothetical protein
MKLLGTILPAIALVALPTSAVLAQDAPSTGPAATGAPSAPSGTPGTTATPDINQPIGATAPPDMNQPIGSGPKADINQPLGTVPVTDATQPTTPGVIDPAAPVMANGVDVPAAGGSQGYGSPLYDVDSRANVEGTGGSFFDGLPIPALGTHFSVNLRGQYQSNLVHLPEGEERTNGDSRSDFNLSPLISGSANIPVGRQQVYLSGVIGKDFYAQDTDYNRGRFSFNGGANLSFSATCHANLNASWIQSQSTQSDLGVNVPNSLTTSSFGASAGCTPAIGIEPSLSYRYSQGRNSSDDPELNAFRSLNDINNSTVVASLGYTRPTLGRFALFGSKSFNTFPNRTIVLGDTTFTSGVNVTNLGGQYERGIGVALYFSGSLYWVNTVPTDSPAAKTSNLGYSVKLNYRPAARYSFSINASSNSSASPSSSSLYFVNNTIGAQFSYKIAPSFNFGLSAITSHRDYTGGVLAGPNRQQSDRVNNLRGSLNWESTNGHYSSSFYVLHQNQNGTTTNGTTEVGGFDYQNWVVGLSLSFRM